jgi:hypothetical protein
MRDLRRFAYALVLTLAATPLAAQSNQDTVDIMEGVPEPAEGEVRLVYEREVYGYDASSQRDPFAPLVGEGVDIGPTFADLRLRGIIYSTGRGQSIALLHDRSGNLYRARRGDIIGNATILEIRPLEVLFVVEDFGQTRQEMLRLKSDEAEGARR